jgi:tRNA-splicing ligase RtcB
MLIPRTKGMGSEVVIFGNARILRSVDPDAIRQLTDASTLPGVVACLGMPDIHSGYGLPIGGVLVVDRHRGVISPGAVGVDINCGVRAVRIPVGYREIQPHIERLLPTITQRIATGVGGKSRAIIGHIGGNDFRRLVEQGVPHLVNAGFATEQDVTHTEERGSLQPADLRAVSIAAKERGGAQIGTLGSGNHFIEFQRVEEVYDSDAAQIIGLERDQVCLMIHSGSRGFGEQICRDYMKTMVPAMARYGIVPPNRNLACVPIDSPEGRSYLQAMACAANFAWVNRQIMMYEIRELLYKELVINGLELIYDVCHNIAKFEEHNGQQVLVHRKGATRAFPAGHPDVPTEYRQLGQPAIIPGSMGTASFIVVVMPEVMTRTYGSVNHGAGRKMSRSAAAGSRRNKRIGGRVTEDALKRSMKGIVYMSGSGESLLDEAPMVYKDSTEVVDSLADIGLVKKIVKLAPMAVLKG